MFVVLVMLVAHVALVMLVVLVMFVVLLVLVMLVMFAALVVLLVRTEDLPGRSSTAAGYTGHQTQGLQIYPPGFGQTPPKKRRSTQ